MCVLCTYLETENNFKGSMLFLVSIVGLGRAVGSITWISGTRIHPVRVYLRRTESRFLEFLNLDSFVLQILFYQHSSCPIFCLSLSLSLSYCFLSCSLSLFHLLTIHGYKKKTENDGCSNRAVGYRPVEEHSALFVGFLNLSLVGSRWLTPNLVTLGTVS